jgi:hypothetical protein
MQQGPNQTYVSHGMPPIEYRHDKVSSFEFWPTWLMYLPVVLQWLLLSLRYGSLTLPLIANPKLPLSGMVGIPKSDLLAQATGDCANAILPWFVYHKTSDTLGSQLQIIELEMADHGLDYPLVCKPDIGCRGAGVKLVHDARELNDCLSAYASGAGIMLQKLASFEPEAGVFFVREPDQEQGQVISLALKYMPYVVGDGRRTLGELVAADPRAKDLVHLYRPRHQERWDTVIAQGEPFRLVFSASHCRGAIFKDANSQITPELTAAINHLMAGIPEFYYGRLDIKFKDIDSLLAGRDLEIVEINTASSESLHIWDSDAKLGDAFSALLYQYRTLFRLGSKNRKRGYKPPGLPALLRHWRLERRLTASYPETD